MPRPDAFAEMLLPEGKTCGDCIHWARCKALICSLRPTNDCCDYSPSRFEAWASEAAREVFTKPVTASNSHAVLIEELVKLREENKQLRMGKIPGGGRVTIQCPFCEAKVRDIKKLKDALCERDKLIGLQRERVQQATTLWQKANDKPGIIPDLGALIQWLMEQPAQAVIERDKLWCKASLVLDTHDIQHLMETFNEMRPSYATMDVPYAACKPGDKVEAGEKCMDTDCGTCHGPDGDPQCPLSGQP